MKKDNYFSNTMEDFLNGSLFKNDCCKLKTDIRSVDNKYIFDIEICGFEKDDIQIMVDNGYLVVEIKKQIERNGEYIRKERCLGPTSRSYYVGDVDLNDIIATYINGLLTITVPNEKTSSSKKYIEVK